MAAIDDLIQQISDQTLRERIAEELQRMAKQKKFGLVYEEHIPECTPLRGVKVKRGSLVAKDITGTSRFRRLDLSKSLVREKVMMDSTNEELDNIFLTDGYSD